MLTAWFVHLYTASGALFAFLALNRIFYDRYQDAFFWLFLAVVVDATDGVLARRVDVASRLPRVNGEKLDDIVDYLTYVFVPAFFVWHALLVPDQWSTPLVAAMLLSSAFGFNRADAKTADGYFTGFPSYWNILVFYLYVAGLSPEVNAAILATFVVLVFVPIRYLYPSRTVAWQADDRARSNLGVADVCDAVADADDIAADLLGLARLPGLLPRAIDHP
jgi:phosphatidylcholine synthase